MGYSRLASVASSSWQEPEDPATQINLEVGDHVTLVRMSNFVSQLCWF